MTVTFNENVTGFIAADITPSNGTVNNFAGSGSVYTFDLVPAGQGLTTADIAANVAQDVASNGNTAATQFSRTYDSIAPTVTAEQASGQADPTGVAPINFTVTFNEAVTGFGDSAADVTISRHGRGNHRHRDRQRHDLQRRHQRDDRNRHGDCGYPGWCSTGPRH